MHNLRRYFELILFQAYLRSTEPDTMQSFETFKSFIENRPGNEIILVPYSVSFLNMA
jgi:hypothetical protein